MATSSASETKKRKRETSDEETSLFVAEGDHREEMNDSDLDDEDDEDRIIEKYNHDSENLPDNPAFDPNLEETMTKIAELIVEFEEILPLHASGSEALRNMHMNAKALCERTKPIPPTFAAMGVRASGKFEINMPILTWLFY